MVETVIRAHRNVNFPVFMDSPLKIRRHSTLTDAKEKIKNLPEKVFRIPSGTSVVLTQTVGMGPVNLEPQFPFGNGTVVGLSLFDHPQATVAFVRLAGRMLVDPEDFRTVGHLAAHGYGTGRLPRSRQSSFRHGVLPFEIT